MALRVDVEPWRAVTGDPTAAWLEQGLTQALPRVLGPYLAPGDRSAPLLEVHIDWLYLAPNSGGAGPGARRRIRSSEASLFGDQRAELSCKFLCGRSGLIFLAPSIRRLSNEAITDVSSRSRSFRGLGAEGARALGWLFGRSEIGPLSQRGL